MTRETHDKVQGYVERLRRNDSSLTKINLGNNNITDTGAKDIAEALKVNQSLTEISLMSNNITDTGAKDIASALKVNQSLTVINLWNNNITDTGAKDIAEALKFNRTLIKINLSANGISPELLAQITTLLTRNQESLKSRIDSKNQLEAKQESTVGPELQFPSALPVPNQETAKFPHLEPHLEPQPQPKQQQESKEKPEKQSKPLTIHPQQNSDSGSDSEELDEETLKESIKTNFCDRIKELNLEDKLGLPKDWQVIKHTKKDTFKLVVNFTDPKKRIAVKNELLARGIEIKTDIIKKTISIENVDANNLDELLVKLESPNPAPSASPKGATATSAAKTKQSQASIN